MDHLSTELINPVNTVGHLPQRTLSLILLYHPLNISPVQSRLRALVFELPFLELSFFVSTTSKVNRRVAG